MKALTVGAAVLVARQLAEGLAEAHKLGIVHRDLKPGNVMIDKDGNAKIMDFGIARSLAGSGMTVEGAIVGTPEYMSPEQVEGKPADPRSDIYSLGIILFEMVVGCPPFDGETPFSIATKHKTEPPPIPKKLVPQLPDSLNKVILRCLEKDKSKRYQTAEELVADLSAVEQTLPLTERALTRAKTKIRTSREITLKLTPRKLVIPAAAVLILAIAIVLALSLIKPHPGPGKIDSLAVLPLDDLSSQKGEGYSVDGMHDALINELNKIPSVNVIARRDVLRYKDSKKTIPEIARELNVAAVVTGSVVQTGRQVRLTVELIDGRTEKRIWGPRSFDRDNTDILALYSEVALTIAREINAQLTAQDIENLSRKRKVNAEVYKLYDQANSLQYARSDNPTDWMAEWKKIIELYQKSVEIDPNFALGYAALAVTYGMLGTNGHLPKDDAFAKAKDAATKALSLDDSLGDAHAALVTVKFYYDWDLAGAEKEFQRALELGMQGPSNNFSLTTAEYLTMVGRLDEAIALQKRIIDSNPLYPDYWILSFIYFYARRFDDSIAAAKKAIDLNLNVQSARYILLYLFALKGMCAEATAEVKKFVSDYPSAMSDLGSVQAVGYAYAQCGNRKKAEEWIEIMKKLPSFDPSFLAPIYASLGEKNLALAALEKGCELRSPQMLWLKVEPLYDSLRNDPRYIALLKKVGFEK